MPFPYQLTCTGIGLYATFCSVHDFLSEEGNTKLLKLSEWIDNDAPETEKGSWYFLLGYQFESNNKIIEANKYYTTAMELDSDIKLNLLQPDPVVLGSLHFSVNPKG